MRDAITLIANSGLQFYTFETKLDTSVQKSNKFRYIERFDSRRRKFWLDEAIAIPGEDDLFARKSELENFGYLSVGGKLSDEIDTSKLEMLDETELFEVGNLNQVFRYFEKKWIPIPFFKKNNINNQSFGPTDWVRIYFERKQDDTLKIVLVVDTSAADEPSDLISPFVHENPNENIFAVCSDDNSVLAYLDNLNNCQWVEDYIARLFNPKQTEIEQPYLKHVANYIFFVRVLRSMGSIPQIHLLSDKTGSIDVDLVIDVGNSNTCAILFENPSGQSFNFNLVKKLQVQDFSNPLFSHHDSFSTRLVFKEAGFGAFNTELNQNNKFQWPSPVRIGFEAERVINDAKVELQLTREIKSYNSSPKRYLWDIKASVSEWEFHSDDMNVPPKRVYKKGISEQLNSDGSLCEDNIFGSKSAFSRQSLMTFVYLEIFSQALRQINSTEFRADHGNPSKRRKLKRIVISCPTAMIKKEQIALRECAVQAMKIINRYYKFVFNETETTGSDVYENEVEVIPSVKDLKLDLYNLEKRKDWIYDEATAPQLVFLYGMIKHKFDGNPDLFFNLYGKPGTSLGASGSNRSLTIGSLDIGGGTSDLMICKYDYHYNEITEITPKPLFWESFNLAGDDLLKEIIQQVIIEGTIENENDRGCSGVIENYARENGVTDVAKKLNGFFGKDSNNIGYRGKLMRTNFMNQIALPIASIYMRHANNPEVIEMNYEQLFPVQKPNVDLLNYFESHFGFRLEKIIWKISSYKINSIIQSVFSKLIKQTANIMNKYSCDIVILSGRPCSFNALEKLFLKYHPVSPNRMINLNHYWIGRWYPFSDNNGFVQDPKTVVSVGSLIALLGGSLYKLDKFRVNTFHLRSQLISTADYIGNIKQAAIKETILSPEKNEGSVVVHSLPYQLGFKNIDTPNYPGRYIYAINFNDERIHEAILRKGQVDVNRLADQIEAFKHKIRLKMPLNVTLSREIEKDKEEVMISEVVDSEQNDISKSYFELHVQSMSDQSGFWLDSGEFTLNIRN